MSAKSKIEWTDATWNITLGCSKVSAGCKHCYAINHVHRLAGNPNPKIHEANRGLTVIEGGRPNWSGEVRLIPQRLDVPLRTRTPTRYFVNALSDLFHESLPDEAIDRVFAVMALCPQHTFQVLTKRAERMREYCAAVTFERLRAWMNRSADGGEYGLGAYSLTSLAHASKKGTPYEFRRCNNPPFPNVWLGVSVEDQQRADERIPLLLQTPAAVRFISAEPLLGPVDLTPHVRWRCVNCNALLAQPGFKHGREHGQDADLPCGCKYCWHCADNRGRHEDHGAEGHHGSTDLDWVIVGGESGPGARAFDIRWAREIVRQCKESAVPCFVKQFGARPFDGEWARLKLKDKKGGDMTEWPEDLRVREMPKGAGDE